MKSRLQSDSPSADRKPDAGADTNIAGKPLVSLDSAIFKDVQVALQAKLGHASLSVQEILALKAGSVVTLDAKLNDLVELRLNGAVIARGEIVAVDDNFAVRIVEVAAT